MVCAAFSQKEATRLYKIEIEDSPKLQVCQISFQCAIYWLPRRPKCLGHADIQILDPSPTEVRNKFCFKHFTKKRSKKNYTTKYYKIFLTEERAIDSDGS